MQAKDDEDQWGSSRPKPVPFEESGTGESFLLPFREWRQGLVDSSFPLSFPSWGRKSLETLFLPFSVRVETETGAGSNGDSLISIHMQEERKQ